MEVCNHLPKLALDQYVPASVLTRRGGISFGSSTDNGFTARSSPRYERRGGISFEQGDKNAQYVRMLGDVKIRTKLEGANSNGDRQTARKPAKLTDAERNLLNVLASKQYRTRCMLRFSSLHRQQKRRDMYVCHQMASYMDIHCVGQTTCLLSTAGEWTFNVFNLDKLTNGRSLFHISLHIFQEHNLTDIFRLDIVKLMRCISLLEDCYHNSNPYHNAVHAADVTQAMHCFLRENKFSKYLTPLEKLVAILSAITHDLDHPGVNQAFLIATSNPLADLYKKTSVLENHHWRAAIGVLRESGVFDHFDQNTWSHIEWQLKSLILSTDITRQQEFMSRLKKLLDNKTLNMQSAEHRHFMLQIALKCADICNPCRPWHISRNWSQQVCDEFFKQGDSERQLQLPVTPLCDRYNTTVAKIQSGFMKFVVQPLFEEWHRFNPTSQSRQLLVNINSNLGRWQQMVATPLAEPEDDNLSESSVVVSLSPAVTTPPDQTSDNDEVDICKENDDPQSTSVIDEFVEGCFPLPAVSEEHPTCSRLTSRRHSLPPQPRRGLGFHHVVPAAPTIHQSRRHSLPHTVSVFDVVYEHSDGTGSEVTSSEKIGSNITSLSWRLRPDCLASGQLEADKQMSAHGLSLTSVTTTAPRRASCGQIRSTSHVLRSLDSPRRINSVLDCTLCNGNTTHDWHSNLHSSLAVLHKTTPNTPARFDTCLQTSCASPLLGKDVTTNGDQIALLH